MTNRADNFNRANNSSAVGTPSDAGSDWVELTSNCGILSNGIYGAGGAATNLSYLETSESDGTVEITIGGASGGNYGLVFRLSDASNYWVFRLLPAIDLFQLGDFQAGSFTERDSAAQNPVAADVISVVFSGTSISAKVNGIEVCSFTSSFNQSATKVGFVTYGDIGELCDNFSFTGGGGGGATRGFLVGKSGLFLPNTFRGLAA